MRSFPMVREEDNPNKSKDEAVGILLNLVRSHSRTTLTMPNNVRELDTLRSNWDIRNPNKRGEEIIETIVSWIAGTTEWNRHV